MLRPNVPLGTQKGFHMAGKGITYAGSLVADTSFKIDAYPREGMQCHITEVKYFAGGIGNNICQMASIDPTIPVHVCGIAGEDDGGENFIRIVSAYPNVDLGPLVREGATSNTLVMNSLESKQRTFFSRPGGSRIFCEDHIDWDKVDCDIFHLCKSVRIRTAIGFRHKKGIFMIMHSLPVIISRNGRSFLHLRIPLRPLCAVKCSFHKLAGTLRCFQWHILNQFISQIRQLPVQHHHRRLIISRIMKPRRRCLIRQIPAVRMMSKVIVHCGSDNEHISHHAVPGSGAGAARGNDTGLREIKSFI